MSFGDGGAGNEARRARNEEKLREEKIKAGSATLRTKFANSFSDKYYNEMLANFQNAYLPDVHTQYKDAHRQMMAALRRSGLGNSSEYVRRDAEAQDRLQDAEDEVLSKGLQAEKERKQDVAYAESNALSQLVNTGDASSALSQAEARIRDSSKPYITPMLGQVFTDLGAGLATQADLERNNQNRYTLFGRNPWWSNSNRSTTNVRGG